MDTSHRTRHTASDDANLSHRVVYAVAEREGVEPEMLAPPLYSVIDPESLDRLYDGDTDSVLHVSFRYLGYRIDVDADGTVTVEEGD